MGVLQELYADVEEFCATTTIQGMRNVTDQKQGWLSRVLWFIVVVVSFVLSGICIKESIDGDLLLFNLIPVSTCKRAFQASFSHFINVHRHYFTIGIISMIANGKKNGRRLRVFFHAVMA